MLLTKSRSIFFLCSSILCISYPLTAATYKCIDTDNKVYFSDRPCDAQQKQTELKLDTNPVPANSDTKNNWKRTLRTLETERIDKKAEKLQQKELLKAQEKARAEALCRHDAELLHKLNSRTCNHKGECTIYALNERDENGKIITLSEHAKQAEIKRLEASVQKNCGLAGILGY